MKIIKSSYLLFLVWLIIGVVFLGWPFATYAHHGGKSGQSSSGRTSAGLGNPKLNLTHEERELLQKYFIELPNTLPQAKDFQGIPFNGAKPEFYMNQNRFVLLNFWATWCVPCLKEMPDLERLHQALGKQGLIVLAIAMGETEENVKKFLKKYDFTFPILADPDQKITDLFGVKNLPATFLIDRNKMIIGRALGIRRWDHPDLVEFFRKKIKVPPSN